MNHSNIKGHWSQITITNTVIMKNLKYCENYQSVTKRQEASKCRWTNDTERLARCRVATDLWCVRNAVSVKCNKAKSNQVRCACSLKAQTEFIEPSPYCCGEGTSVTFILLMMTQRHWESLDRCHTASEIWMQAGGCWNVCSSVPCSTAGNLRLSRWERAQCSEL